MGTEAGQAHQQVRQLTNVFRRVYRIFAHAWFQHREMFWKVERESGLYVLFKTVCDVYQLIPEDNYTIPPEAEGLETEKIEDSGVQGGFTFSRKHTVLKKEDGHAETEKEKKDPGLQSLNTNVATGNTTKRHRHSPSTGATPVDTVIEENEEEDDGNLNLSKVETLGKEQPATQVKPEEPFRSNEEAPHEEVKEEPQEPQQRPDLTISSPPETTTSAEDEVEGDTPVAPKHPTETAPTSNENREYTGTGLEMHPKPAAEEIKVEEMEVKPEDTPAFEESKAADADEAPKSVED